MRIYNDDNNTPKWVKDSPLVIVRHKTTIKERHGKLVWRITGKAGADLTDHPAAVELDRVLKKHNTEVNKACRGLRARKISKAGLSARQTKAEIIKESVLEMNKSGLRNDQISNRLKITVRQVQRIIKAEKAT